MENNPFSQVYNGLWRLIERNQILDQYIRENNLIKFTEENEVKQEISDSDVPELQLIHVGGTFNAGGNSSSRTVIKNYAWTVSTGSMKIGMYNILSFEIFRSMIDFECILCPLTWCNCHFVDTLNITNVEEGTRMQDLLRSIPGWCALWNFEVKMSLSTEHLRLS